MIVLIPSDFLAKKCYLRVIICHFLYVSVPYKLRTKANMIYLCIDFISINVAILESISNRSVQSKSLVLILETVEESSRNEEEVKRLKRLNERLEMELVELHQYNSNNGLSEASTGGSGAQLLTAPTAMISTLARRVVSQLGADSSGPTSLVQSQTTANVTASENLEESMRKVNKYVGNWCNLKLFTHWLVDRFIC